MKHAIITGGNAGIGLATARSLAEQGMKVIIAGRSQSKIDDAVRDVRSSTGNQDVHGSVCDLASFKSINEFAASYQRDFGQLDILINNAGLIADKLQLTEDGFELQIGVNHLGHFLLTNLLLELLQLSSKSSSVTFNDSSSDASTDSSNDARIINVSSNAHYRGQIDFDSFRGEMGESNYDGMKAYGQSKLANVLFTAELARRFPAIKSYSLHPGVVSTQIAGKNDNKLLWRMVWKLFSPFMLTPEKGARTSIYLTTSNDTAAESGAYFYKQKSQKPSRVARDGELAKQLWELSANLVAL